MRTQCVYGPAEVFGKGQDARLERGPSSVCVRDWRMSHCRPDANQRDNTTRTLEDNVLLDLAIASRKSPILTSASQSSTPTPYTLKRVQVKLRASFLQILGRSDFHDPAPAQPCQRRARHVLAGVETQDSRLPVPHGEGGNARVRGEAGLWELRLSINSDGSPRPFVEFSQGVPRGWTLFCLEMRLHRCWCCLSDL